MVPRIVARLGVILLLAAAMAVIATASTPFCDPHHADWNVYDGSVRRSGRRNRRA